MPQFNQGDVIQCRGARRTKWRIIRVHQDGTLDVESVPRQKRLTRPERYNIVGTDPRIAAQETIEAEYKMKGQIKPTEELCFLCPLNDCDESDPRCLFGEAERIRRRIKREGAYA